MKAVILAGGKGIRMYPITELIPKALVKIDGLPIIHQQLIQLERANFQEVIILTGHLGKQIQDYLYDHEFKFKLKILHSPSYYTPAQRLLKFSREIRDDFILIYCDNYLPSVKEIFEANNSVAKYRFLLHKREKGNIKIDGENRIIMTTTERKEKYPYVELGYIQIRDKNFFSLLSRYRELNECLCDIARFNPIDYEIYTHDYKSISNLNTYLKEIDKSKVLLIDRDGIINKSVGNRKYLASFDDLEYVELNLKILQQLSGIGFSFIIITNQPGISTGEVSEEFLNSYHQSLSLKFLKLKINLLAIYTCKHHWDDSCLCRKPKPGLIMKAIFDFKLENQPLIYIGDDQKDESAARAAGIEGIVVNEKIGDKGNFGLIKNTIKHIENVYSVVIPFEK